MSLWSHWICASICQLKAWHRVWCPWSCANIYQLKACPTFPYISIFTMCSFINSCYMFWKQKAEFCLSRSVEHGLFSHYKDFTGSLKNRHHMWLRILGPFPEQMINNNCIGSMQCLCNSKVIWTKWLVILLNTKRCCSLSSSFTFGTQEDYCTKKAPVSPTYLWAIFEDRCPGIRLIYVYSVIKIIAHANSWWISLHIYL